MEFKTLLRTQFESFPITFWSPTVDQRQNDDYIEELEELKDRIPLIISSNSSEYLWGKVTDRKYTSK